MIASGNQSRDADRQAILRAQAGDADALTEMTERHDALVKYVANRFRGRGAEWDDLYQIGRLGLIKAIRHFDLRYDVRFSTYAVPIVMGEIRRFLRDDGQIHISRTVRENAARVKKLLYEEGDTLGVREIAERLHMPEEDVVLALNSEQRVHSFEEPVTPGETLRLCDTVGFDPNEKLADRMDALRLLSQLSKDERAILFRRYILEQTQSRIAAEFGMTQVQVSRLESRIINRLRARAIQETDDAPASICRENQAFPLSGNAKIRTR